MAGEKKKKSLQTALEPSVLHFNNAQQNILNLRKCLIADRYLALMIFKHKDNVPCSVSGAELHNPDAHEKKLDWEISKLLSVHVRGSELWWKYE